MLEAFAHGGWQHSWNDSQPSLGVALGRSSLELRSAIHPALPDHSLPYHDRQGITFATVGEGVIRVRDVADGEAFDFRDLNRDADDVQRLIRDESFEINLPAIELSALSQNLSDARALFAGLGREAEYARQYRDLSNADILILSQRTDNVELRRYLNSPAFNRYRKLYQGLRNIVRQFEQENGPLTLDQRQAVYGLGGSELRRRLLQIIGGSETVQTVINELQEADEEYDITVRTIGFLQATAGVGEVFAGAAAAGGCSVGTAGAGTVVCVAGGATLVVHGVDNFNTGYAAFVYGGENGELQTSKALRYVGTGIGIAPVAVETLVTINDVGGFAVIGAAGAAANAGRAAGAGVRGLNIVSEFRDISQTIAPQKQARHVKDTAQWRARGEGGYFNDASDAQEVLNG